MSYEEVKNAAVVPVVHDNKQPCRRVSVGGREQACPTALREVGANECQSCSLVSLAESSFEHYISGNSF